MGERGGKQCAEEPTDVAIKNPTFQRKMDPTISCGIMQMLRASGIHDQCLFEKTRHAGSRTH